MFGKPTKKQLYRQVDEIAKAYCDELEENCRLLDEVQALEDLCFDLREKSEELYVDKHKLEEELQRLRLVVGNQIS